MLCPERLGHRGPGTRHVADQGPNGGRAGSAGLGGGRRMQAADGIARAAWRADRARGRGRILDRRLHLGDY